MTADAVGGVWQYSLDLVRGLVRHGVEVTVATMGPRPSAHQREQAHSIPGLTLVESDYALEWMTSPWADVDASTSWLQALAEETGSDLVHLNGYSQAAAPNWRQPVVVVAHSCVPGWWRAVYNEPCGGEWNDYKQRVRNGVSAAAAVIAPTLSMAKSIEREYGFPAEQIRVIHNSSRAPRCKYGGKKPFGLAAGRVWDRAKNLKILERAANVWPIEVAGPSIDPQTGQAVESSFHQLGVLEHDELLERMCQAAVFVHPALYEPFGLSVLEAARARCCLVLSDIDSLRELWDGAAVFVDPGDPEAWRHELQQLKASAPRREHLGQLALDRSAQYSAFESTARYLDLYRSLLGEREHEGVAA